MADDNLRSILRVVAEKTGTEVRLRSLGGEETHFVIGYLGKQTDAWIDGVGEEAEKRARLVAYFLENADFGAFPDRREYLRSVLLGDGGPSHAYRYMTKYNLADGTCYCVEIVPDRRREEAFAHVERCLAETQDAAVRMDDSRIAVVKFSDEEQTPYEFAQFLSQSLYEELGVRTSVGVGCEMRSFTEIAVSYAQAATAVRMSGIFHAEGEVHSYREYLLVRMLEDVPKSRLKEYMEQFRMEGAAEVFDDEDMTATAEEFLESSLNISETSRNLFMHRNTLTYRLDKIERATGLNIRKFSDAVTFRVITILYKLLNR